MLFCCWGGCTYDVLLLCVCLVCCGGGVTCVARRCDVAAAMCVGVWSCFIIVAISLGKSSTCSDFSLFAILRLVSLSVMDICTTNMTIALVLSLYVSAALISPCMC